MVFELAMVELTTWKENTDATKDRGASMIHEADLSGMVRGSIAFFGWTGDL